MKLLISKCFAKDTRKIRDERILLKLRKIIAAIEACGSLEDITEATELSVTKKYRIPLSKRYKKKNLKKEPDTRPVKAYKRRMD